MRSAAFSLQICYELYKTMLLNLDEFRQWVCFRADQVGREQS